MTAQRGLKAWHDVIEGGNSPKALAAIIHEDAVFHSPVVHTPQPVSYTHLTLPTIYSV